MPEPKPVGGCVKRILPFLLVLMLSACGTDAGGSSTTSPTTSVPTTTTGDESTTSAPVTSTTAAPIDAASALSDALVATGDNYRFVSTITVDETVVTTIVGVVDGSSVQADITTGETTLSYIRTGEGEWTRETDDDWVQLEGAPPVEQPLTPLNGPQEVELVEDNGESLFVTGRLGEAAGSAAGVGFSATIAEGLVTEIAYQAETGGQTATVTTQLSDIGSAGSVEAPTEGG